ncbi:MAG: Gfo/Idh/MocA family oxidoreductase [Saprospiraceae bacterium]
MKRRKFIEATSVASTGLALVQPQLFSNTALFPDQRKSIGIIGLDTSHAVAFTKILNEETPTEDVAGFRVTHAFPRGSWDIESSTSRIPAYTEEIKTLGVKIVNSIPDLLKEVDFVLLETNDGRLHLDQALQVFEAGKPVFIDKPLAASLKDVLTIFSAAERYKVPVFSASSLRFSPTTMAIAKGEKIGKVLGADTYSPAKIEETHPDLFWYGIHGVESLCTLMGIGCKQVRRIYKEGVDMVIGEWEDGRIGTFRGIREGKQTYGGTAFGTEGVAAAGLYEGYRPLVVEIVKFFQTGIPPVSAEETIEIFTFMEAAEESKRSNGGPVSLKEVLASVQK